MPYTLLAGVGPHTTSAPRLCIVAALAENRVIGSSGALPWRLPEDLRRFKAITMGAPIIMGRATHDSIGRPLPGRKNIVLTRQPGFEAPGCVVVHTLDAALDAARPAPEAFVVGGGSIYAELMPRCDRMYLTLVHREYAGDAWFPEYAAADWREIEREEWPAESGDGPSMSFVTLERRTSPG